jgi:hypothetical protein
VLAGESPPIPPPTAIKGVWTSANELLRLPASGPAWSALLSWVNKPAAPHVADQDDTSDVIAMAKGIVYSRTGETKYKGEAQALCLAAIGTETGARALALGRNLIGYAVAADLCGFRDVNFVAWLERMRRFPTVDGPKTLVESHEKRPNNWGTHAGASRAAIAVYLGDQADLDRCARVFRGWLGETSAYAGFEWGDLWWQADPAHPVGINPRGSTQEGHSIDGVLPDDQRRGGPFVWPPPKENYVWEALQGALAQALVLSRAGYTAWEWSDKALLRAVTWLHSQANFPAAGDDTWLPHLANWAYAAAFPAPIPSSPGKNAGFTDWTHQGRRV